MTIARFGCVTPTQVDPDVIGGRARIRGMRVTVSLIMNPVASRMGREGKSLTPRRRPVFPLPKWHHSVETPVDTVSLPGRACHPRAGSEISSGRPTERPAR
jgi:hypothetical protein